MGDPTKAFINIPNRILDHLIRHPLPPTQSKLVMWIIRDTYGRDQATVERDLTRISSDIGVDKTSTCRALRHLIADGVVSQNGKQIRISKDFGEVR